MIRAFTIAFDFEGKVYLALASVSTGKEAEIGYQVRLYNESLTRILSASVLCYKEKELEKAAPLKHPLAKRLIHCIHDSVKQHLRSVRMLKADRF